MANEIIDGRVVVKSGTVVDLTEGGTYTCPAYAGYGGAFDIAEGGTVTGTNVTFAGNTVTGKYSGGGGAIYNAGIVDLTGATFTGNVANYGGAVGNGTGGTINFTGSSVTFCDNTALYGGAVANYIGTIDFGTGSVIFNGNTASLGGAIYNYSGIINFAGTIDLATTTDKWLNDTVEGSPTVNWDITNGLGQYATIKNFERYINASAGVNQTITVTADQEAGEYVIATGDLTNLTNKDTFTVKTAADATGVQITVGDSNVKYGDTLYYSLANVNDAQLVLTVTDTSKRIVVPSEATPSPHALVTGGTYTCPAYAGDGGAVYVDGGGTVTGSNVTFAGNTVTGEFASGGAIYNWGTITFTDVALFTGNTSANSGGAIDNGHGTVTLSGATFACNTASYGGAIDNSIGTITISDVAVFADNTAANSGGGIYNSETITLADAVFTGNTATDGGAIYNEDTIDLAGTTFTDNIATQYGGAICNSYAVMTLTSAIFSGNSASDGGAIANFGLQEFWGGILSITDAAFFEQNAASGNGGAVYSYGGTISFAGATFTGNTVAMDGGTVLGGAIYNRISSGPGIISFTDDAFFAGNAGYGTIACGGAVYNAEGGTVCFAGATFTGNTVVGDADPGISRDAHGGAIYNSGTITFTDTAFFDCNAVSGGANYGGAVDNRGTIAFAGATFTGNTAQEYAGALYNTGTVTFAENVSFSGNTTAGYDYVYGGGIYNYGGTIHFNRSAIFDRNAVAGESSASGGGIYNMGTITFDDVAIFTDNVSSSSSGAIYNGDDATITFTDIAVFTGNTAGSGGGAVGNDGTVTFAGATFAGNNANHGGAICNGLSLTGSMLFTGTALFTGNTAGSSGGAVDNDGTVTFSGATFAGNNANYGGGIYNNGTAAFTDVAVFTGNTASAGGGIYNVQSYCSVAITLTSATFAGNNANHGGAIANMRGTISWSDASFTGNIGANGGAIANIGGTVSWGDARFAGNTATDGGAILNRTLSTMSSTYYGMLSNTGDARFEENVATHAGGAVYNDAGTISLAGATFTGNTVAMDGGTVYGGAIYNQGAITFTDDAFFVGNAADGKIARGGAVSNAEGGTVCFAGATFTGNTAGISGGAIENDGVMTIQGAALFENNVVEGNITVGGAINNSGNMTLESATFTGNRAASYGGAVFNSGNLSIGGTALFQNNQQVGGSYEFGGGAIYNYAGTTTLADAAFTGNTAYVPGGAVYNDQGTFVITGNALFSHNEAQNHAGYGGAVYNDAGTVSFAGATFTGNTATHGGSALYNKGVFSIDGNVLFDGNIADSWWSNGGAVFNDAGSTLTIGGTATFLNNQSYGTLEYGDNGLGGAICNGGTLTLAEATFSGNTARLGGAISNTGCINFTDAVTLMTITDNIYNQGTLNWDLTGGTAAYGKLNGYQWLTNNGDAFRQTITVSATQEAGQYVIATGDLSSVTGKDTFTVKTAADATGVQITVGDSNVKYGDTLYYSLANVGNAQLVLTVTDTSKRVVVPSEATPSPYALVTGGTYTCPAYAGDGGAVYVDAGGTVTGSNVSFAGNSADRGGAIYNSGTITLSDCSFETLGDSVWNEQYIRVCDSGNSGYTTFKNVVNNGTLVYDSEIAQNAYVTVATGYSGTGTITSTVGNVIFTNGGTTCYAAEIQAEVFVDEALTDKNFLDVVMIGGSSYIYGISAYQTVGEVTASQFRNADTMVTVLGGSVAENIHGTGHIAFVGSTVTGMAYAGEAVTTAGSTITNSSELVAMSTSGADGSYVSLIGGYDIQANTTIQANSSLSVGGEGTLTGKALVGSSYITDAMVDITGTSNVTMTSGSFSNSLIGGALVNGSGSVTGTLSTGVTFEGGTVKFLGGGCYLQNGGSIDVSGTSSITISGGEVLGNVYGGNFATMLVYSTKDTSLWNGNTNITIDATEKKVVIGGYVAAGSYGTGKVSGNTTITLTGSGDNLSIGGVITGDCSGGNDSASGKFVTGTRTLNFTNFNGSLGTATKKVTGFDAVALSGSSVSLAGYGMLKSVSDWQITDSTLDWTKGANDFSGDQLKLTYSGELTSEWTVFQLTDKLTTGWDEFTTDGSGTAKIILSINGEGTIAAFDDTANAYLGTISDVNYKFYLDTEDNALKVAKLA